VRTEADEDIQALGVAGMSSKGRKKAGVGAMVKGFLRKKAGTKDDPEEMQMVATIKKRMKIKGGQVEAIRFMKFTVGSAETDKFTAKQAKLQAEGMPFFRRIGREIGLHDQIVIWVEKTVDQDEFLTDIEVSASELWGLPAEGFTGTGTGEQLRPCARAWRAHANSVTHRWPTPTRQTNSTSTSGTRDG
jgi:hypothetical protein